MAAVEPEEINNKSLSIKVTTSQLKSAVTDVSLGSPREVERDVNQIQQVMRDAVVHQTISHHTSTIGKTTLNNNNKPLNNIELTAMPRLVIGLIHRSLGHRNGDQG